MKMNLEIVVISYEINETCDPKSIISISLKLGLTTITTYLIGCSVKVNCLVLITDLRQL